MMLVRHLEDCPEFVSGDHCILRETLHPLAQDCTVRYSLAHATLPAGKASTPHRLQSSEVYYILRGRGIMHIDDGEQIVGPNDTIYIPPNARQYIETFGPEELVFLCIVDPAWRPEDETVEG